MNSRVLLEDAWRRHARDGPRYTPTPELLSTGSCSVFTPLGTGVLGRRAGERIDSGPEMTGAPPRIVSIPYQPEADRPLRPLTWRDRTFARSAMAQLSNALAAHALEADPEQLEDALSPRSRLQAQLNHAD